MSKHINLLLVVSVLIGLQACSGNKYLSQPANSEFKIDGLRSEWSGRFEIPKNEDFAIGMSHDENYLYVAINSMNRTFERQLAMRGLTVWVDVKGKKHETLGFKFQSVMPMDRRPGASANRPSRSSNRDREDLFRSASPFKGDLELIVIDSKGRESLGPANLHASAIAGDDGLFMEYQIPLAMLGEKFDPANKLGVGINSEFDKSNMPSRGQGGMSGGMSSGGQRGSGGGGGGGKRGGGGGHSGMQGSRPDQTDLNVWFKVELIHE